MTLAFLREQVTQLYPQVVANLAERNLTARIEFGAVRVDLPQGFYVTIDEDLGGFYVSCWTHDDLPATLADGDNFVYASDVDNPGYILGSDIRDAVQSVVDLASGFVGD